jgi:hypothetical protein
MQKQQIEIYDIDGTLTYCFGDISDTSGLDTYAFWPLVSDYFSKDEKWLRAEAAKWNLSMKHESDPTGSSHRMMQLGIDSFRDGVTVADVRARGRDITRHFLDHDIVRLDAIKYLARSLQQGTIAILSTGSYRDAALGFVDFLIEQDLLPACLGKNLFVSGAVVDWQNKKLEHANVLENKLIGLEKELQLPLKDFQENISAVFADDPFINDRDIVKLAPTGSAYIINTIKNQNQELPSYCTRTSWQQIFSIIK